MKEYPMLFSAPMVRAILDGRKTQTRRIVKGARGDNSLLLKKPRYNKKGELTRSGVSTHVLHAGFKGLCPYGQPGDRLWVRETWAPTLEKENHDHAKDGFTYRADWKRDDEYLRDFRWKPSIHMPRRACRIVLEIVSLRVERLNAISENDAEAEGVTVNITDILVREGSAGMAVAYQCEFIKLWQATYGAESWLDNPWIWVIEFKRVQP